MGPDWPSRLHWVLWGNWQLPLESFGPIGPYKALSGPMGPIYKGPGPYIEPYRQKDCIAPHRSSKRLQYSLSGWLKVTKAIGGFAPFLSHPSAKAKDLMKAKVKGGMKAIWIAPFLSHPSAKGGMQAKNVDSRRKGGCRRRSL
jgi:hypothetical protein